MKFDQTLKNKLQSIDIYAVYIKVRPLCYFDPFYTSFSIFPIDEPQITNLLKETNQATEITQSSYLLRQQPIVIFKYFGEFVEKYLV
ncbi:hypothetical protein EGR_06823 [Echinococcus granulosus]|uniref:Uncharacterized protein n=1 Tax=Echinococcus granulosus TaxID=6210 RepID=W6UCA0_ECHGR|nr:hypothetical protein EGR_06823 [Echinococcus granulosus]EUB58296.1 hypothetical protein EGR_06823 [Echinococcus granulosus]